MLALCWLVSPRGARRHVVDEFMMLRIEAMLVALKEQPDRFPGRFPIGAEKSSLPCCLFSVSCTPRA